MVLHTSTRPLNNTTEGFRSLDAWGSQLQRGTRTNWFGRSALRVHRLRRLSQEMGTWTVENDPAASLSKPSETRFLIHTHHTSGKLHSLAFAGS